MSINERSPLSLDFLLHLGHPLSGVIFLPLPKICQSESSRATSLCTIPLPSSLHEFGEGGGVLVKFSTTSSYSNSNNNILIRSLRHDNKISRQ